MKYISLLIILTLLSCNTNGQNLEERIKILEKENEKLRTELTACKSSPFTQITKNLENQKFENKPEHSREELHSNLIPKIKEKSTERAEVAKAVIEKTNDFLSFCNNLTNALVQRTGGIDSLKNRPKGCFDKEIGNLVLIKEGKGSELKENIISLRQSLLTIVESNPNYKERITLEVSSFQSDKYNSWEEYKFIGMPLCAIMPMIVSFKARAKESEITTLQYLNE